jgi:hypothetical protein
VRYHWRDWSYEIPDGLTDRSVIVLEDESVTLSLAHDALSRASADALAAYVDEVARETGARVHALRVLERVQTEVEGKDAVLVTHDASPEPGETLRQVQAFVRDGASVTILSATCAPDDGARAREMVEALARSMKRVSP